MPDYMQYPSGTRVYGSEVAEIPLQQTTEQILSSFWHMVQNYWFLAQVQWLINPASSPLGGVQTPCMKVMDQAGLNIQAAWTLPKGQGIHEYAQELMSSIKRAARCLECDECVVTAAQIRLVLCSELYSPDTAQQTGYATPTQAGPRERHSQIEKRAHEIWMREGRPEGHAEVHWRLAEAEIDRERGRRGGLASELFGKVSD